ncbi:hypothetical protein QTH97_27230 [Variovorax sp. J22R24]|uniref:hypothetical protein n=1 Tax=Variovorax gracilis TaxID=3053502 RepID=UPI00257511FD|nr:hypothetical protein [Variovorax sp. J22R24]MDM0108669.1 hypothetical protein [Variovorax sp. J22R24]
MSFFSWLANGLGTLIGVVTDVVSTVVDTVRSVYDTFVGKGGAVKDVAAEQSRKKQDRLREVNDEIMHLRNRGMSGGGLSDQERRRWNTLREEREELKGTLHQAKEVKAAEKILDSESVLQKVEVDLETTHVLQYNAFADTLGKTCTCGRQMKLQWRRDLSVAGPSDFYWGCTGWYVPIGQGKACNRTEPLQRSDYGLMTDTSAPEFSVTAEEFGVILEDPGTANIVVTRVNDLRSDLAARKRGVELATCPVHGEHMVLRKKGNPSGLLDTYFLACPHWQPHDQGCTFIEKLKSGSQLAALLKAETGRGIL